LTLILVISPQGLDFECVDFVLNQGATLLPGRGVDRVDGVEVDGVEIDGGVKDIPLTLLYLSKRLSILCRLCKNRQSLFVHLGSNLHFVGLYSSLE
jgi:hypothetical protein